MIFFVRMRFIRGARSRKWQCSDDQAGESSVVKVNPEDYESLGKDCTSVKVICLGDSAVGKSK